MIQLLAHSRVVIIIEALQMDHQYLGELLELQSFSRIHLKKLFLETSSNVWGRDGVNIPAFHI